MTTPELPELPEPPELPYAPGYACASVQETALAFALDWAGKGKPVERLGEIIREPRTPEEIVAAARVFAGYLGSGSG